MKRKSRKALSRSFYLFSDIMINLKTGTKFQKQFHKWYNSGSDKTPYKIYDYIMRRERNESNVI